LRQPTRGDLPAWRLGEWLTTPHRKKNLVAKLYADLAFGWVLWNDFGDGKWI